MKETMPDISFERSMNHNYMILSRCDFFGKGNGAEADYRTRMLLENSIPGLLPVTHRMINGESRYYYEINSLQSLDRLYGKSAVRYDELKRLLSGCVSLFDRLEEYLLDGTQIIIKPELIYVDIEKMEPYFVCYPEYEGDVRLSFMEFVDELLTKIDHTDERAVMLGYQVYRYTRNPNYVISEIGRMMEHVIVDMARPEKIHAGDFGKSQEKAQEINDTIVNYEIYDREEEANYEYDEYDEKKKSGNKGDLVGGIFCILVSLCAGAIVLAARFLGTITLSERNELYLYGAMGMSLAASVLFFSCYIKKRKQDNEIENSDDDDNDDAYYSYPQHFDSISSRAESVEYSNVQPQNQRQNQHKLHNQYHNTSSETACLGESVVEERVLCGRMDGREVNVTLDRLPMTVGKLSSMADFVINDSAVSKMHARFEEHDGRVYVCDLNSTNGTVRNGVLLGVNQSVRLEPGDRIRFGRTCFTYC